VSLQRNTSVLVVIQLWTIQSSFLLLGAFNRSVAQSPTFLLQCAVMEAFLYQCLALPAGKMLVYFAFCIVLSIRGVMLACHAGEALWPRLRSYSCFGVVLLPAIRCATVFCMVRFYSIHSTVWLSWSTWLHYFCLCFHCFAEGLYGRPPHEWPVRVISTHIR
jgi:hypothetical protein